MPKIYLNERDRLKDRISAWMYGQMKKKQITQQRLAKELCITQQAFSQKLKRCQFSIDEFMVIVNIMDPEADELMWLIGRGRV